MQRAAKRVVVLTNFLAPYRLQLMEELVKRFESVSILLSAPTEQGRLWPVNWGGLPVAVQGSIASRGRWRHPHSFSEDHTIHIPYDTIPRLAKIRPDVIVAGELGARTVQSALYRKLAQRSRLVIWATLSETTEQGRGWFRNCLRHALLRAADAIIVNGKSGARYVQRFGAEPSRIFHAPQTTSIQHFLDMPLARSGPSRRRLLYSGQLNSRKGLQPFIAYLSELAERQPGRPLELWLAGDGPLRKELAEFRCPENLQLRFLGHVDYARLPEIYAQAGMLVFPTLADEWGLVVVEAMAAGLPVLGSLYSQAVEELVIDGTNGWTFRPDDPEMFRTALGRATSASVAELDRLGSQARSDVERLTPAAMADQMAAAIEYAFAHGS